MASRPTLVVVSGPPGSGKTTLAHRIACIEVDTTDGYQPPLPEIMAFVNGYG